MIGGSCCSVCFLVIGLVCLLLGCNPAMGGGCAASRVVKGAVDTYESKSCCCYFCHGKATICCNSNCVCITPVYQVLDLPGNQTCKGDMLKLNDEEQPKGYITELTYNSQTHHCFTLKKAETLWWVGFAFLVGWATVIVLLAVLWVIAMKCTGYSWLFLQQTLWTTWCWCCWRRRSPITASETVPVTSSSAANQATVLASVPL